MNKVKTVQWLKYIVLVIVSLFAVFFCVRLAVNGRHYDSISSQNLLKLTENWVYEKGDVKKDIDLPDRINTVANEKYTLSHTLIEEEIIEIIGFKSNHSAIKVLVENNLVYEWGEEENLASKGNPDSWHLVDISGSVAGDKLIIEVTPSYTNGNTEAFAVFAGAKSSLILMINNTNVLSLIPAFGIFFVALVCLLIYFSSRRKHRDVATLAIFAASLLTFCIWALTSTELPQFYFGNIDFFDKFGDLCLLVSIFLLMLGISYEYRERLIFNKKDKVGLRIHKVTRIFTYITLINLIGQIILQTFVICDFFELIGATMGIGVIVFLIAFIISLKLYANEHSKINLERVIVKGVTLVGAFITYMVAIFYFTPTIYVVIKWLVFFYAIGTFARMLASLFTAKESNKTLTTELSSAKQTIMINQIKPHFLYNALTAIKSMCAIDPKKAEESIVDFSTYLRSNISPLSQKPFIFFAQELNHIKSYLKIETLRFGEEKLKIVYDIKEEDFMVPPLTIEVLVENAVRHGLFKKVKGGTVTISSWSDIQNYYVTVKDDGIGFDVSILDVQNDSLGIRNVKYRLEALCQASISFDSTIGVGTVVTVTIPKSINQETAEQYKEED